MILDNTLLLQDGEKPMCQVIHVADLVDAANESQLEKRWDFEWTDYTEPDDFEIETGSVPIIVET